jgi:hypothetical protein
MRKPEIAKRIIELSKIWNSNSSEFSKKLQDLEQEIVVDYHNFLDTGASEDLFIDRIELRSIIEKIIYKMLEVGDLGVREAGEQAGWLKEAKCWKGYKAVGMKKKKGKTVPNCVRKES